MRNVFYEEGYRKMACAVIRQAMRDFINARSSQSMQDEAFIFLTGRQAKELGFVDTLGTMREAIERAAELGGVTGKPVVVRERKKASLWDTLRGQAESISRLVPGHGVSLEYRLSFD